jgi:hypothetical protein
MRGLATLSKRASKCFGIIINQCCLSLWQANTKLTSCVEKKAAEDAESQHHFGPPPDTWSK